VGGGGGPGSFLNGVGGRGAGLDGGVGFDGGVGLDGGVLFSLMARLLLINIMCKSLKKITTEPFN